MKTRRNPFMAVAIGSGLIAPVLHAGVAPYASADADTSYLYHFDEASGSSSAANAGSTGRAALSVDGNPWAGDTVDQPLITTVLGFTGKTGFGNAASVFSDACLGVDADGNGAFRPGDTTPVGPDQMPDHSTIYGVNNAFTLEAMVNVSSLTGSSAKEIICTDHNGAAVDRGFQFRISTTGQLEFNAIGTTPAAALVPIPTTGTHGFVPNEWFHAAVTYDGTTLRFFWTKVDASVTVANEIGSNTVETVELADDAVLVLGNEGRSTGGLGGEPLTGMLDEVRISKVARTASQFIFFDDGDTDNDGLPDGWETSNFGDLDENGSGDYDFDDYSNLEEFNAGSDPDDPGSIPDDIDADGLSDEWENLHFGNLSRGGNEDPDGDMSLNENEETAGTDPNSATSFPDADSDGLSDGWEDFYFYGLDETLNGDPDGDLYLNHEEYTLGTDPTSYLSSPDSDADGLVDGWEAHYFFVSGDTRAVVLAKQNGAGDPDGDGYTNESEEAAGTNPTTLQKPTDMDGDGLLDSWETFHFGHLDEVASGNPDGDSGSNLQEQNAGSNPNSPDSTPTDIDGDGTPDAEGTLKPYTVDSNTLHLWHLDEVDQPALDAGSSPLTMTTLNANGRMWDPSFPGFATGLNTTAGRGTVNGGVLSAHPLSNTDSDDTTLTYAGADGAFTFEGIVRVDFDPTVATVPTNSMQIVTGESELGTNRVWQFRIVPIGGPQNAAGTSPRLEFINLHGDVNIQPLSVALPTSGDPDAIEQGGWYHVAVTYNGSENTADNFKLYWTKLDPARTQANEVFSGQMTYDLITSTPDFTIGNEGRDGTPATGSTDGFAGIVDEIRISDIARTPSQFLFSPGTGGGDTDGDGLPDAWETTYFGNLGQTAGGDFDHDDTNNLAEYRLGLVPNSGSSRFAATHGAGGQLQWPSVTGVTFKIERSTTLAAGSWEPLENAFPGTAGTATYTDPNPPVGKAFYKVTLNP